MRMKKWPCYVLALLLGAGCDTDKDPLPDPTPDPHANTIVTMAMHWLFGTEAFSLDSVYEDDFGHKVKFDEIRFYLAQPWFEDDLGDSVAAFPDKYFMISAEDGATIRTIGELDGHLHELHVILGLDSAANHTDPSISEAPLNDFLLWWGWSTGRVFLRVLGKVDSDGNGVIDGSDTDVSYDCGRDNLRQDLTLQVHTDADAGGTVILDLNVDVQGLIEGIDMVTDNVTHTDDDPVLAATLMTNMAASITHD